MGLLLEVLPPPALSLGLPPLSSRPVFPSDLSLSTQETGLWRVQLEACLPLKQHVFTEVKNSVYSWPWGVRLCDQGPRLVLCCIRTFVIGCWAKPDSATFQAPCATLPLQLR